MISGCATSESGVSVDVGGRRFELSWTWLRDHARDAASFEPNTQQRLVSPAAVSAASAGRAAIINGQLRVEWDGDVTTEFDAPFLAALGTPSDVMACAGEPEPWTGTELADRCLPIAHRDLDEPAGLRCALDRLWRDGVVRIHDVPISNAATRSVIEKFGYVRSTIFGDLWDFSSDDSAHTAFDDTASTPLEITPHTDGTYSNDAPGLLALHCHRYDAVGGENVFVDSHAIVSRLTAAALHTLRTIEIPGQYIGDGAHLMARRPALRFEADRLVQVSYNHHDRAPFVLPEPTMSELFDALHEFDALSNAPELQFEVAMRPGDMVVFDNWRVLHGRRAFDGSRLIAGGYVNREDVESTTRRLG